MKGKRIKSLVTMAVLVILVLFGVSRLKFQSVSDYRSEAEETASELEITVVEDTGHPEPDTQASGGKETEEQAEDSLKDDEGTWEEQKADTAETIADQDKDPAETSAGSQKDPAETSAGSQKDTAETSAELKKNIREKTKDQKKDAGKPSAGSQKNTGKPSADQKKDTEKDTGKEPVKKTTGNKKDKENAEAEKAGDNSGKRSPENSGEESTGKGQQEESAKISCEIEIVCPKLAEQRAQADERIREYIPQDGKILGRVRVKVGAGSSVYDVLAAVCKAGNIPLDARYTPLYSTYYVEGIGNIYERQAGDMSGWIYKVNGVAPDIGASGYRVREGDEISWRYTCDGRTS